MVGADKAYGLLAGFSLFEGVSRAVCQAALDQSHYKEMAMGEYFFHQGDDAKIMYVLAEGRVKLTSITADGHQVIVTYIESGEGMGIIVALSGMAYPLSAEALEPSIALAWSGDDMNDLMHQHPQLALNGIKMIGGRFAALHQRYQDVATLRVEQRIARAIVRLVRQYGKQTKEGVLIDIPITREDIAQMTGTNIYNTSRILSKWERDGLVSTGRKQIVLVDAHGLIAIAEDLPTR